MPRRCLARRLANFQFAAVLAQLWLRSCPSDRLLNMSARTRKLLPRNNHLEEAMALLIQNQAAFVEQISRNDQERLALKEWQRKTEDWQRRPRTGNVTAEARFDKIEERLANIETTLAELPKTLLQTILDQIPKIRKEIGFKPRT